MFSTFASDFPTMLFDMPQIVFVAGVPIVMTYIIAQMVQRVSRERTKREIAAYVAEGTIDADKAVSILKAGRSINDVMAEQQLEARKHS